MTALSSFIEYWRRASALMVTHSPLLLDFLNEPGAYPSCDAADL